MRDIQELAKALREVQNLKSPEVRTLLREIASLPEVADDGGVGVLLSDILERDDLTAAALARWLGERPMESAAQQLLRYCSVRYLHAVSPPEIEISALSLEEALLAAKRMNRMLATPAYVVGWILGILKCWPSDKNAVNGCDQVLHYLVQEFPGPMYPLTLNLSSR